MAKQRTGSIYKGKCGNWYARITFTCSNGKRKDIKRRAKTKTAANDILKSLSRQLDDEGETAINASTMSFNALADYYHSNYLIPAEYVDERKICGLRDVYRAECCLIYFREHFGNKKVRDVTYGDIYSYRNKRLKEKTKYKRPRTLATVHRELSILRRMFNIAQREGFILKNPFNCGEPLIQPSAERRRERILTIDEEERLLKVCSGARQVTYTRKGKEITAKIDNGRAHLKALIIGLLDTGARKGEMLKLTWQFVDFENRVITFHSLTTKTLKTRQVAITQRFYAELQKRLVKFRRKRSAAIDLLP